MIIEDEATANRLAVCYHGPNGKLQAALVRDVEAWVKSNARGKWSVTLKDYSARDAGGIRIWCRPQINFEDPRDEVLFKTFWL